MLHASPRKAIKVKKSETTAERRIPAHGGRPRRDVKTEKTTTKVIPSEGSRNYTVLSTVVHLEVWRSHQHSVRRHQGLSRRFDAKKTVSVRESGYTRRRKPDADGRRALDE